MMPNASMNYWTKRNGSVLRRALTDIFSEEISACFEGNRQVDEAARMIENRLNLFLAESAEY